MFIKPRDVQVAYLAEHTRMLRSRTWDRLKFEIEYSRQKGTTANAYLIEGDKLALLDPPGESFTDIFLDALKARIHLKKIDYLILSHINPNRGVTLKKLLELAPQVQIICSNPGAIAIKTILPDTSLDMKVVKGGDNLDLGKGHQLEFIPIPLPLWPDEMCTYDNGTNILYTDKLFGAHVCGDQLLDEGWTIYTEDRRYYFDCLMAPHAKQVEVALQKLKDVPATTYATGHGPLVHFSLTFLQNAYRQWAAGQQNQEISVAVVYASAYGNTTTLAQAIARGITKAGVAVEFINAEIAEPDEIKSIVQKASGVIFGSPTLGGHVPTPIQTALGITLGNIDQTKLVGVFGSYGWSGEAVDLIEGKFRDGGYRFGFDSIKVKFKPTDVTLKYCEEVGTDFAQTLKKAKRNRQPRASVSTSQAARTEQALGRVVGSLCVMTTKQGELAGGMLASWVSQATFNPPGLTVAVAKERAIESLLPPGSNFVLNILQEGKHISVMKHFLKPFTPGEDRFQGIDVEQGENGCPILQEALAYVECRVEQRMECGDHWLVYATVDRGKVLEPQGVTAVHHRKSGSHY